jgi:hypothetical protein
MSVYDPLRDYLQQCNLQNLRMSFAEIEDLLGRPLPPSARRRAEWWANEDPDITAHVQCRAWQSAGYAAEVNLTGKAVTFRRNPN